MLLLIDSTINTVEMSEEKNLSNTQQTTPLLLSTSEDMSGLQILRQVDSLYVKQHVSLTESRSILIMRTTEIYVDY